ERPYGSDTVGMSTLSLLLQIAEALVDRVLAGCGTAGDTAGVDHFEGRRSGGPPGDAKGSSLRNRLRWDGGEVKLGSLVHLDGDGLLVASGSPGRDEPGLDLRADRVG